LVAIQRQTFTINRPCDSCDAHYWLERTSITFSQRGCERYDILSMQCSSELCVSQSV